MAASLSAPPTSSEEPDGGKDGLPADEPEPDSDQEEPQVSFHVREVTQGEHYEALMDAITEDGEEPAAPPQVMEITATLDGQKLDLSGCQITVQADPNSALAETVTGASAIAENPDGDGGPAGTLGLVVTVQPLGGEPVERIFTSEEMESGEALPSVAVTYTVPRNAPAMYAVSARAVEVTSIELGNPIPDQIVITQDTIIDLKGTPYTCKDPLTPAEDPDNPGTTFSPSAFLFLVKSGATLTVIDSGKEKTGGITANGLESLITVEDGGTLNIQAGTLRNNGTGGSRVIFADGNSTVNMSGGTITGGNIWTGAGIYMASGTVNLSGDAVIEGNTASNSGGGVHAESGTVNIYGGRIANNTSVYGGGVYTNTGAIHILGGEITGNTAVGGGGVCAFDGSASMQGGTISGNTASSTWEGGGGIYAKTVELSGGTISENHALYEGGGIYAKASVTMTGGTISGNTITGTENLNANGGGVSTDLMIMRGGEISGNSSAAKGGGVYAARMMMTGGTISGNMVQGTNAVGGGGIYIAKGTPIFNDGGMADHGIYNMSLTGGTISGNQSDHVGGGIYVDVGAKVHIRGTSSPIYITGNSASDKSHLVKSVHGFAGGGIFVEHPNNTDVSQGVTNKEEGGQLYLYDAVVTGNNAKYGGGVAGCGASSIMISSASGVAVYRNTITGTGAQDIRYPWSTDLYCDGKGSVASQIGGQTWVTWEGRQKDRPHISVFELKELPQSGANGETPYENGFYLNATDPKTDIAAKKATVFIQNNTSASGGGGIGGNGYMEMGFQPPEQGTLVLKKIVEGLDTDHVFKFTVLLTGSDEKPYTGTPSIFDVNGTILSPERNEEGAYQFELRHGELVRFTGLPNNVRYTITEEQADGFKTAIAATGEESLEGSSVSGALRPDVGSLVEFTNTAIPYELPATGGGTSDVYIGAALLTAAAGILICRKRVREKPDCQ